MYSWHEVIWKHSRSEPGFYHRDKELAKDFFCKGVMTQVLHAMGLSHRTKSPVKQDVKMAPLQNQ